MTGVLVFVEQNEPKALPLCDSHFAMFGRDPRRHRHLRTEIQCPFVPKRLRESFHQGQQRDSLMLGIEDVEQLLGRPATLTWTGAECVHQFLEFHVRLAQLVGVHQMFGQLTGEGEYRLRHRRGISVGVEIAVPRADHTMRELPQFGLRQQRRGGLDGQQQAVLGEQSPGIRVVGAHLRLGGENPFAQCQTRIQRAHQIRPGEPRQPSADSGRQLLRSLAGEGQSEYLIRIDEPVGHHPHHSRGHRLGLPSPCACHDERRTGWGGDHRRLLVGGWVLLPEGAGQFDG
ncbi:unannotated protein [freshwater metagenome]|uniref:Unannotated protein n=1 Tax=freshwater metagenome TaxID=449393 RepID=A0A6J7HSZ7_9ZZZZ